MARILFAWELGGGAGHVHIIGPLARALAGRGHQVSMAVRELPVADGLLEGSGVALLPAPFWAGRVGGLPPAASFPGTASGMSIEWLVDVTSDYPRNL